MEKINIIANAVIMLSNPVCYTVDVAELTLTNCETGKDTIIGIMPIFQAKYPSKTSHEIRIRIVFDFLTNTVKQFWGLFIDGDKIYRNNLDCDARFFYKRLKDLIKYQLEKTNLMITYIQKDVGNDISVIINI